MAKDYDKRYQLAQAPEARNDGSGQVAHQIKAQYRETGSGDAWQDVPGRNKTILILGSELNIALASGTQNQKVTAYKDALISNLNTVASPIQGWDLTSLEDLLDANDVANEAASDANEFITVTLGLVYPVGFNL